tara:strand:+ start:36 stop:590 length:555 start_codon:yes stop_codon:yes gene_type:complete
MSKNKNIFLNNINKYYKEKKEKINKIFDLKQQLKYNFTYNRDKNIHIVEIYNKNNKLIFQSNYDIVGLYNIVRSVWYWGYNISMVDQQLIKKSRNILNISKDIIKNYSKYNSKDIDIYHYYSNNGNFMIKSSNIPNIIKLGLYSMEGEWVLPIRKGLDELDSNINDRTFDTIEYISIYNISKIG